MSDGPPRHERGKELPVDPDVTEASPRLAHRRKAHVLRGRGDILLVIATGGALGSLGRWWVGEVLPTGPWRIPWGTWLENVSGAFALGLLMVFLLDVWPPRRYLRPFLGVGVLGGYTTFSTYMLDTRTLLADRHVGAAVGYLAGTMVTGLVAVAAGVALARLLARLATRQHPDRRTRHRRGSPTTPTPDPAGSDPSARSTR